jgi:hypothetical protein
MMKAGKIACAALFAVSLSVQAVTPVINFTGLYNDITGSHTSLVADQFLQGGNTMTLGFQIKDLSGFSNLSYVLVTIFDATNSTLTNLNSDAYHATYKYYRSDESWNILGPSSWGIERLYSTVTKKTTTATNVDVNLVFSIGSSAVEETAVPAWHINIGAVDNSGNTTNIFTSWYLVQNSPILHSGQGGAGLFAAPNPVNLSVDKNVTFLYSPGTTKSWTADLRIYTIYGELVKVVFQGKSFTAGSSLSETWNGKNGAGNQVASGLYSAILDVKYSNGQTEKSTFNFAVYR